MSCTKPGILWDNILPRFRELWFIKQTCSDIKNMSPILFQCASFSTDFYYFWHYCHSFRIISKLICVFEFVETVDIISLQQCFLVQIQKCVVYLNVWKIISPVSSPTHPFLSLSLIMLPIQSLTPLSLLPSCVKVLKPSNCHHWIWTVIIIWDQELLLRRSPGMDLCSSLFFVSVEGYHEILPCHLVLALCWYLKLD